ncbi:hypothetical protein [Vreelandella venusta]|uniref:hypothetical protein n=1 Tax=Vreelandella venusta TaxID=44935 RepID=UPI00200C102B|nr:hypothetical protein [Halomonas venusta]UQI42167.1 hypothetical protein M3L73_07870 [Halomonas venusta]
MPRFKAYNYDQNAMVVINYQDQLQPGTFEHALYYLIEHKLDLSVFHSLYRNDATLNRFRLRGKKKVQVTGSSTVWCSILRSWRITAIWLLHEGLKAG